MVDADKLDKWFLRLAIACTALAVGIVLSSKACAQDGAVARLPLPTPQAAVILPHCNDRDCSLQFAAALARARIRGVPLYIPARTVLIKDVQLRNHDRIIAAPGAVIRTPSPTQGQTIFKVIDQVVRVHIQGGTWRDAGAVIEHTSSTGKALEYSTFTDMHIRNVGIGFKLDGVTNCRFERLWFSWDPVQTCFAITGVSSANHNVWTQCSFVGDNIVNAIEFRMAAQPMVWLHNRFESCLFEDLGGRALIVNTPVQGLTFTGCWFERNTLPISIAPMAMGVTPEEAHVSFVDCFWNPGEPTWNEWTRMRLQGYSSVTIRGGSYRERTQEPQWNLIETSSQSSHPIIIDSLRRVQGTGELVEVLASSQQQVVIR